MTKHIIAIDIGGTKMRSGLVSGRKVITTLNDATPRTRNEVVALVRKHVTELSLKHKINGIGIAFAGMVDGKKLTVTHAQNLPHLTGWKVKESLQQYKFKIILENDGHAFLRGEVRYGIAQKKKNVVGIVVGTGIGGSIAINGEIYSGSHGTAGEVGHMLLQYNKTLENLAGKTAFDRFGDRSEYIGMGVANIINILDPEMVVLSGGAIAEQKINFKKLISTAREYIIPPPCKSTPIVPGKLGNHASLIGVASLF